MVSIMFVAIILGIIAFLVVNYLMSTKTKKSKDFSMLAGGAVGILVAWAYSTIMLFRSIAQMF